jgi:hypothetical protein
MMGVHPSSNRPSQATTPSCQIAPYSRNIDAHLWIPFKDVVIDFVVDPTGHIGIERIHRIHAVCPGSTSFGVFFSR